MSDNKIKIGITHGDANGIGYEVIVKSLCDPRICELCTPVVYGSAKAAGFYKKQIEGAENLSFNIVGSAAEANPKRVNLVNCCSDELRVEPGEMTPAAGAASVAALKAAATDPEGRNDRRGRHGSYLQGERAGRGVPLHGPYGVFRLGVQRASR